MSKHVVVVESPTKAKTISKFLSKEYDVIASVGHVRDLPRSASDIPQKYKNEPWSKLGIDVEHDFKPIYVTVKGKGKIINAIKQKVKESDSLILATDEDREGESIANHILEMVKPKIPVKRMVFHEITKSAIEKSLDEFRDIDQNLVKAQETRRTLDRLVGYRLSSLLWKKITYKLSAGRVQSPGLRLIVERERERNIFVKAQYENIVSYFEEESIPFTATLNSWNDKKIATGSNFDQKGKLTKPDMLHLKAEEAQKIVADLQNATFEITKVEENPQKLNPPTPFTTSTLQQESNKKLQLSARQTMRTAQSLYENGLITYMRTDSPALSTQAIEATRNYISKNFDSKYLPEKARIFSSKSKNAQEAHEAIRPAGEEFVHPDDTNLSGTELSLYKLIWQRTIASQMEKAEKAITSVEMRALNGVFNTSGSVITFPGFLAVYSFSKIEDKIMPTGLVVGKKLQAQNVEATSHETKPPGRFNDASLVKQLEALGIGRPSTYASIINTLIDRGYVRRIDQALVPTLMGFAVVQFLERHFENYVDYNFTANMEDQLDEIATGNKNWLTYLKDFYLGEDGLDKQVEQKDDIDDDESRKIDIPTVDQNKYEIRVGRYGPFVLAKDGDEVENFSVPEDCKPADINEEYIKELAEIKRRGPQSLGKHPETGEDIYCLTGRYGPYVQLGEITEENPKPKRAQVTAEFSASTLSLEEALKLLSLPRIVGKDPKTNEDIEVRRGRFGPYLTCGERTRTLKKEDDVYTVGLERCLELLAQEPKTRKRSSSVIKDFGEHPKTKKNIGLYNGPYGIYLKYGTKNIKLPEDKKDEEVAKKLTLEEVLPLLKEKKDKEDEE